MKTKTIRLVASVLVGTGLLAACGGGDDDLSGGRTAFSVVPTQVTWSPPPGSPPNSCPGGGGVTVHQVLGGAPPYRILSTSDQVSLSADRLDTEGGTFSTIFNGGCGETFVTVRDQYNATITLTIKGTSGS
jgi:hypothetical protein